MTSCILYYLNYKIKENGALNRALQWPFNKHNIYIIKFTQSAEKHIP